MDAGVFFSTPTDRASKVGEGEFRCSGDLDCLRQVGENGFDYGRSTIPNSHPGL